MPDPLTPGQGCYDAYWQTEAGKVPFAWHTLTPRAQHPWEAAAQAAITTWWQAHEAGICGDETLDDGDFPPLDLRLEEETP